MKTDSMRAALENRTMLFRCKCRSTGTKNTKDPQVAVDRWVKIPDNKRYESHWSEELGDEK